MKSVVIENGGRSREELGKGYILQIEEEIKGISDIEKLKKIYEYVTDLLLYLISPKLSNCFSSGSLDDANYFFPYLRMLIAISGGGLFFYIRFAL